MQQQTQQATLFNCEDPLTSVLDTALPFAAGAVKKRDLDDGNNFGTPYTTGQLRN